MYTVKKTEPTFADHCTSTGSGGAVTDVEISGGDED